MKHDTVLKYIIEPLLQTFLSLHRKKLKYVMQECVVSVSYNESFVKSNFLYNTHDMKHDVIPRASSNIKQRLCSCSYQSLELRTHISAIYGHSRDNREVLSQTISLFFLPAAYSKYIMLFY